MPLQTKPPARFHSGQAVALAPPVAGLFSRTKRSSLPTGRGAERGHGLMKGFARPTLAFLCGLKYALCFIQCPRPLPRMRRAEQPVLRHGALYAVVLRASPAKKYKAAGRHNSFLSHQAPKNMEKEIQKSACILHTLPGGYINGQRKTLFRPASARRRWKALRARCAAQLMSQACSMREYRKIAFMAGLPQEGAAPAGARI